MVGLERRWRFGLLAAALLGAWGWGAAPRAEAEEPPARSGAELVLKEEVPIEDFLRALGQHLKLSWNPQEKAIQRKLLSNVNVSVAPGRMLEAVRRVLAPYDLVLVPMGARGEQGWWVADLRQPSMGLGMKPEAIALDDASLATYEGQDGRFVTTAIRVRGVGLLRDARLAIQRLVTQNNIGSIGEVPGADTLIVTDFAPAVCAIYRVVRQMEASANAPADVPARLMTLRHANAIELARVLAVHAAPPQQNVPGQPPMPPLPERVRVTADGRTNQLVVSGGASEVEAMLVLVKGLDVPLDTPATTPVAAHVITLRTARAQSIASVLQTVAQSSMIWTSPDGTRPSFVADSSTNSLVITAPERTLGAIRDMVRALDPEPTPPREPAPAPSLVAPSSGAK
jgi:type II secretory pathway component GspD/PulD (secretin)